MPEEIVTSLVCDFTSQLAGRFLIATGIAFNGDVLAVSLDHKPQDRTANGSSPVRYVKEPHQFRINHAIDETIFEVELEPLKENIYFVQLLPDGNYLIGGARGVENLHVFDTKGRYQSTRNGGDAIEDIQVAPDGKVWVSHFDEGYGCAGSEGLCCFSPQHEPLFDFNERVYTGNLGEVREPIVDCYMLNVVSAQDVWLCPYVGFSLYHLHDFQLKQSYEIPDQMAGANAFAISKGRVIFTGGYHLGGQLFWHDLHSKRTVELKPITQSGEILKWNSARGRGSNLFLWNESAVFKLNVEDFWPSEI